MDKIVLTIPGENDVYGVQEVFYKTWLDTYPNKEVGVTVEDIEYLYKDAFTKEILEKRKNSFLNPSSDTKIIIAKDKEKVVGVCRVWRREKFNQLQAIYVLPDYQGKGIGYSLWRNVLDFFDPEKDTIVEVATYNTNAIEFYKKLGFSDTGERFPDENFKMKSGSVIPEMRMIIKVRSES